MTGDYIVYNLIGCVGIIQAAVAYAGITGLCFFKNRFLSYFFALAAVSLSSAWFFLVKNRNIKGLEGTEQFTFMIAAASAALGTTLLVSSIINHKMRPPEDKPLGPGFEALKYMSFFQAIKYTYFRKDKNISTIKNKE